MRYHILLYMRENHVFMSHFRWQFTAIFSPLESHATRSWLCKTRTGELRLTKLRSCCIEIFFSCILLAFYAIQFFSTNTEGKRLGWDKYLYKGQPESLFKSCFHLCLSYHAVSKTFSCGPAVSREICKIYKISFSWDHNNMANLLKFQTVYIS